MADLDNAVLETDGEDDLLSDLRSAFKSEEAAPVEAEAAPPELETPEVEDPKDDRSRDEKGRFAARIEKAQEPTDVPAVAPVETPAVPAEPASDPAAQAVRPPPGWSPAAKVAFDSLPAEVRQAVANRELEVNKGFAKLSEYKPLDPYIDYARQNNTTLDRALQQYVGIEQLLKRDFVAGIETLCRNSQIDPVQLANVFLARSDGAASNAAAGNQQNGHQTPAADLQPILQEVHQLKSYIASQQQQAEAQKQQAIQAEIQAFEANPANRFFPNVRHQMADLMRAGIASDMADAYDKACKLDPEVSDLLIKQQTAGMNGQATVAQQAARATQARQATRSITGSPTPGAAGSKAELSIEDDIRAQFRANHV